MNSLLRRQAGVISRSQAISVGMSTHAVDRRVGTGRWTRLHPVVYLVEGSRRTDEVALRAAVLWAGEDAAVSGPWAAWWQGMLKRPSGPLVVFRRPAADADGMAYGFVGVAFPEERVAVEVDGWPGTGTWSGSEPTAAGRTRWSQEVGRFCDSLGRT